VPSEQFQELRQASRVVGDPAAGQQLPVAIDEGDEVVILGPVDATEHVGAFVGRLRLSGCIGGFEEDAEPRETAAPGGADASDREALTWRQSSEPLPWPATELLKPPLAESLRAHTH
jgi:hypothetical protein